MATMNFSVPDEVKNAFNVCFSGKNKSAVISNLMMQAVTEEKTKHKRAQAIDALLALRDSIPKATIEEIAMARQEERS